MVGNNSIVLNEATMKIALQMYFDHIYKKGQAPKVISVNQNGEIFNVKLDSSEADD